MSLNIKVLYGDKLYRLSPQTKSLQQIDQEMKQRFPTIRQLAYYYEDQEVQDISALISRLQKQGATSLKLVAKSDYSSIQQISRIQTSKISVNSSILSEHCELMEKIEPVKAEEKLELPLEFYLCYNCSGKGEVIESSFTTLCSICKGRGKLDSQHKYVLRLKELYQNHFCPARKPQKILEELKEVQPERKSSIMGLDKNYEVIVSETTKKEKAEINRLFTMKFEIKNVGKDWDHKQIFVIESGCSDGKRVSALKSGEQMSIEVGPFLCKDQTILEKTYSLFYKEGDNLVRFGHKFGFAVKGAKKCDIKINDSIQREKQKIQDLKMLSGSNKSKEYLTMKLKSLGIDILNIQMEDEILLEIIRQIK